MMSTKMDLGGSRDLISDLPKDVIGHILSFFSIKEAASTSVLSKKWRYLFALTPNLDFNDSVYVNPPEVEMVPRRVEGVTEIVVFPKRKNVSPSFMDFVDRVLALQGNSPIHKFSLKVTDRYRSPVDSTRIFGWILNVLERGVLDIDLNLDLESECLLPSEFFLSKTLGRIKLNSDFGMRPVIDVKDAYLPKLKTLYIHSVHFEKGGVGFVKLLSGCPMLENLDLEWISWCAWDSASVCVSTLKRLRFRWVERDDNPKSLSFDTPNLVYLDYTDTIADKYPKLNFGSLVEARIDLRMSEEQMNETRLCNATNFITGLCNVKILYLSANTLESLNYCCEAIPLFNNLTHLTIKSNPEVGWQTLPRLLKNSPNLETLVFQGLIHEATNRCGVVCLCKPYEGDEEIFTCLTASPVKVLKIRMKVCRIRKIGKLGKQIEQVKHFLETMPNLEQQIIYLAASVIEDVTEVSSQLRAIDNVASSKCIVRLISDNLKVRSSITITLP